MGSPADKTRKQTPNKTQANWEGRNISLITTSGERERIMAVRNRSCFTSMKSQCCKQQVRVSVMLRGKVLQRPLLFRRIKQCTGVFITGEQG